MEQHEHQFIDRTNGKIVTELLYTDKVINMLYSRKREENSYLVKMITSPRFSSILGFLNYDFPLTGTLNNCFLKKNGLDLSDSIKKSYEFKSMRELFERQIKYWDYRTMPKDETVIVSPADSRILVGSLNKNSLLYIKEKFFNLKELLGENKKHWIDKFVKGQYAIFRLTPDKYHYNHVPVSGVVSDFYEIDGTYHSCNPGVVVRVIGPYSKNKRTVTIIDTDVHGGSQVGKVAMIEVVALMIGRIVQCYSETCYNNPQEMKAGMFIKRGCPKSLFRPGSSTVVLLFEKDRVEFSNDIMENLNNTQAKSRFSTFYNKPFIETDVQVRSEIARKK